MAILEDDLGIVYLVDNAQQFWSELEDILALPKDEVHTLALLDATLKRYLAFCAAYHEQYLQSPLQLEHACNLIVQSELFAFHSERMCEIMAEEARTNTDPHSQLISYHVLLCHGRRRSDFFRSHKRWFPLLPLLMDHVLVEIDSDVEDAYFGNAGTSNHVATSVPVPIEAKLRSLCIRLLYEVCRVQKFSVQDLRIFDDAFIDYLFDLVEETRHMQEETLNYSVIKLIVALNEQFMVASLPKEADGTTFAPDANEPKNRVLRVLMRRLGSSQTFGENMIFMLNRAQRTPEDLCMQLLVLKLLYLLFTTKGTSEYFYTNDLCVLVDVFLRELADMDDESESLRHTYLRVLHPLLTKTQLRDVPYKRPQIVFALESLTSHSSIRDISPTTRRLVERCLSGDWCVQLRKSTHAQPRGDPLSDEDGRHGSGSSEASARNPMAMPSASAQLQRSASGRRTLKSSKSVEFLKGYSATQPKERPATRSALDTGAPRRPSNASSINLVASATAPISSSLASPIRKGSADSGPVDGSYADRHRMPRPGYTNDLSASPAQQRTNSLLPPPMSVVSSKSDSNLPPSSLSLSTSPTAAAFQVHIEPPQRRSAPPPPPKRRKPPAIPVANGGATITTIRSSVSSPLAKSKFSASS
ncbi:hypothetical protein FB45DRAFT_834743 [Roridomyces roridus]|uniref:SPIN90/Ldb17 leucine-rich domain-containing protein n=1 Tax=Roridomyces roridus TaxID=1738132 RepID=A0AAD7BSK4_9AGAR|nr:hypothetical protein FB45DRAFT_834743 [Roridomyces roridus]